MKILLVLALTLAMVSVSIAHEKATPDDARSTPAYEVLVLRRVAVTAELGDRRERLTSEHPDVRRVADELRLLNVEIERIATIESSQLSKLTAVYGRLILKRVALQVEANELRHQYIAGYPLLRQKQRELSALEFEIESLLR